jgi:predicted esterase
MSIVGQLQYLYDIDRRNVLMTGFSGGGFPVYFVGLRHPDVFSAVVARNANFNRKSLDGWYPEEARKTPVMVYYGQNDLPNVKSQSQAAAEYLREAGFQVESRVLPGKRHERRPEVAMDFWLKHWNGTPPPRRHRSPLE